MANDYEVGEVRTDRGLIIDKGNYGVDPCHRDFGGIDTEGAVACGLQVARADTFATSKNQRLIFRPGTYRISTNLTLSSSVEMAQGAVFSVDTGVTLTIAGLFRADPFQCFSGLGTVTFSRAPELVNAEWWTTNATPGTTDMTTALQKAVDSIPERCGTRIPIRAFAISDTVEITAQSVTLEGFGWGKADSDSGSYLKWIGEEGSSMVKVQDCQGVRLRDFRFIGDSSAKPSAALEFYQAGSTIGNDYNVFQNLLIGRAEWDTSPSSRYEQQFTRGIHITGSHGGNDSNKWDNIKINYCDYGIDIDNSQYLIQNFTNLYVWYCKYAGVRTKADINGMNWFFAHNADATNSGEDGADIITYDSNERPTVTIVGFNAESSGRLCKFQSDGTLAIYSGYWQQRDDYINADLRFIDGVNSFANVVRLHDFSLQAYPGYAGGDPTISLRAVAPGEGRNALIVSGACVGLSADNIDMNTPAAAGNEAFISFQRFGSTSVAMDFFQNHLGPSQSVDDSRFDVPGELNATIEDIVAPTLLNSWVDYDAGTYQAAGYFKDGQGVVHLVGSIKSGTITSAAFQLPATHRPNRDLVFAAASNGAFGELIVRATGDVIPNVGSNTIFSLDGISFRAA